MQFLLERLDSPPLFAGGSQPFDLKAAVQAQIERIVSTRVFNGPFGSAATQEFGMPSIVDLSRDNKSMLEAYAARLTRMLVLYEPRLAHPQIELEASSDKMMPYTLVVRGILAQDDEPQVFSFPLSERLR